MEGEEVENRRAGNATPAVAMPANANFIQSRREVFINLIPALSALQVVLSSGLVDVLQHGARILNFVVLQRFANFEFAVRFISAA